ncbi:MAG: PorT family protein [Bacteroidaceae bacterium]|nr:PorT family protein [Bacteroidaceae bacterium]
MFKRCLRIATMVVLMAGMFGGALPAPAQTRKVQNRPYIDLRAWHYGFLFGLHLQDLEMVHNGHVNVLEDGTEESWFADVPSYSPGFNVGVLGEARFTNELSLRIIPTMYFGDKTVEFCEQLTGAGTQQTIKSTYFTVPVDMKWSAPRFNNYRPYMVAGVVPMLDLTVKKQKELLVHRLDFCFEVGMGCDFYLPFFKLIPEVKFCFGLPNVLVRDRSDLIDKNLLKYTQAIDAARSRMIVFNFYFE